MLSYHSDLCRQCLAWAICYSRTELKLCRKYRLISHPGASNPFPYAFLNYHSVLCCKSITVGNMTFMEWSGAFDTVPEVRRFPCQLSIGLHHTCIGQVRRLNFREQAIPLLFTACQYIAACLTRTLLMQEPGWQYHQYGGVNLQLRTAAVAQGMEEMHNMIEDHITSGFNGLRSRMARKSQAPPLIASGPSITVASPGYSYSQTQSHHFHSNSPAAQSNPLLNTGLMPGGPIDMFMSTTSEPGSTSRRSQFVSPSLLNVSRGSNLSGGSTASQHSQVSHRSEVPSDVHGQTRLSYHEPPEVKNRSQGL